MSRSRGRVRLSLVQSDVVASAICEFASEVRPTINLSRSLFNRSTACWNKTHLIPALSRRCFLPASEDHYCIRPAVPPPPNSCPTSRVCAFDSPAFPATGAGGRSLLKIVEYDGIERVRIGDREGVVRKESDTPLNIEVCEWSLAREAGVSDE